MSDDAHPRRNGPWTVHETALSYENPWIRVETSKVAHPDGSPGIYGVVRYANFAIGVLPIDESGHTWIVGQHRFPFDAYSWELPEGGGPKAEDPLDAAKRELAEETGLRAENWQALGRWDVSNSVSDEKAIGYLAWGLREGEAQPEPSEALTVKRVSFPDLVGMCLDGEITDAFTHLMVFAALERARRGELPEEIGSLLRQ